MKTQAFPYPTEFTVEELEKLRELAMKANSMERDPFLHNLGVKCTNYVDSANRAIVQHLRYAG